MFDTVLDDDFFLNHLSLLRPFFFDWGSIDVDAVIDEINLMFTFGALESEMA